MESLSQNKGFIITVIVTLVLLVGGIFLFSNKSADNSTEKTFSQEILSPSGSSETATVSAEITLVEFGDYQCPACGVYHPFVKKLLEDLKGQVNFVFRHFPLSQHKNAPIASYVAISAGKQNKYWEMHNILFEKQAEWSDLSDPKETFIGYAKGIGLDISKFESDIESKSTSDLVSKDMNDGRTVGINATPTYFVNGKKLTLPSTYDEFKNLVISLK